MRISTMVAGCTAGVVAALSAWPAAGAPALQETTVPVAGISCNRTEPPPKPVTPAADVMSVIDGKYRLSNGATLALAGLDQRLVADFGRAPEVPLVAIGPNRFESRDGTVKLRYEADARTERIVVSYPADNRGRYVDAC